MCLQNLTTDQPSLYMVSSLTLLLTTLPTQKFDHNSNYFGTDHRGTVRCHFLFKPTEEFDSFRECESLEPFTNFFPWPTKLKTNEKNSHPLQTPIKVLNRGHVSSPIIQSRPLRARMLPPLPPVAPPPCVQPSTGVA